MKKTESFTDLQRNKSRSNIKSKTVNNNDRQSKHKNNQCRQSRDRHVMNVEHPSAPRSPRRRVAPYSTNDGAANATAMSVTDIVFAAELGAFDLDDTNSIDSTPFCRVCLKDNHEASRCQQVKKIATFIRTRNRNFEYWRNRREGRNEQPRQNNTIVSTSGMVKKIATLHSLQTVVRPH